jgi:hypothetical protein
MPNRQFVDYLLYRHLECWLHSTYTLTTILLLWQELACQKSRLFSTIHFTAKNSQHIYLQRKHSLQPLRSNKEQQSSFFSNKSKEWTSLMYMQLPRLSVTIHTATCIHFQVLRILENPIIDNCLLDHLSTGMLIQYIVQSSNTSTHTSFNTLYPIV